MNKTVAYENLKNLNSSFEEAFKGKFGDFLNKGWYVLGEEVKLFEEQFAKYCGAQFCVGVANGLDALELGFTVFNFPPKSEVIVPSNTYIASILSVINSGHVPVLVEPDINTYNIDPDLIEQKITEKTKAIMVVHLYGQMAQMDKICHIAKKYGLEIIEDCAQSHGAVYDGKIAGTFGKIGAYSFYPTKNLGALGDSGAIVTNDEELYKKIKACRNYGSEQKYFNKYIGRNSRLDELQAAFLNIKLPFVDKINSHKQYLARIYDAEITNKVVKPIIPDTINSHVFHIYNIRTPYRDELKKYLHNKGISTEIHYPVAPNKQEGYNGVFSGQIFPISELIHETTLSLPISYATSEEEVRYVSTTINDFFAADTRI